MAVMYVVKLVNNLKNPIRIKRDNVEFGELGGNGSFIKIKIDIPGEKMGDCILSMEVGNNKKEDGKPRSSAVQIASDKECGIALEKKMVKGQHKWQVSFLKIHDIGEPTTVNVTVGEDEPTSEPDEGN